MPPTPAAPPPRHQSPASDPDHLTADGGEGGEGRAAEPPAEGTTKKVPGGRGGGAGGGGGGGGGGVGACRKTLSACEFRRRTAWWPSLHNGTGQRLPQAAHPCGGGLPARCRPAPGSGSDPGPGADRWASA